MARAKNKFLNPSKLGKDSGSKRGRNSSLIILSLLISTLFLLIGFPVSNSDKFVQAKDRRNILDGAIKEIFSSSTAENKSHAQRLESNQIASIGVNLNESKVLGSDSSTVASFPFVHPVMGPRKSSGYGYRVHPIRGYSSKHKGLDLAAPVGASIRSMAKGRVIFADPYAGYGKLVVIDHGEGITTHYAHCDRLTARTGDMVQTGQIIAEVGSTGASTGPHLHLEVRVKGVPINPEAYFEGLVAKAEG